MSSPTLLTTPTSSSHLIPSMVNPTLPTTHTGSEFPLVILSLVRSMPRDEFNPELVRGDRSWLNEHLGFVTNPHQICVGITRSKHGLIIVGGLRIHAHVQGRLIHIERYVNIIIVMQPATYRRMVLPAFSADMLPPPPSPACHASPAGNERLLSCDETWNKLIQDYNENGCIRRGPAIT